MRVCYRVLVAIVVMLHYATTFGQSSITASSHQPKREFRGAWVATVGNLDWPSTSGLTEQTQRNQLANLLDGLKSAGINAVVLQIRPECDALYPSPIEPWSYWLSGQQGVGTSYDPLHFAIEEAHKRGMELHAWFNPYRSVRVVGTYPISSSHVSVVHPEWNIAIANFKFLDPGLPDVRNYVTSVIMDVVRRYDVDGVHFDDYFYPYPPNQIGSQDDATFAAHSRGFTNRGDWRRDNVNLFIKMVYDSIKAAKPHVKFGVSPFGIWKNGVPSGITGLDAYSTIYCDGIAWLRQRSIDYITPQLYWPFGGGQDYGRLMPWWADSARFYGRHYYPGEAAYRIVNWTSPSEMPNHIRLDRATSNVHGNIFFRANSGITDNPKGFRDSLRTDLYRYPSLLPAMAWGDSVRPYMPRAIRYEYLPGNGPAAIQWDLPLVAPDGDTASRYVVYRFDHAPSLPAQLDSAKNIISIEGRRYIVPPIPTGSTGPFYYVATALDRNFNESEPSSVLMVPPPASPALASPANGAQNQLANTTVRWSTVHLAASYQLQVTTDSTFASGFLVNQSGIQDTFHLLTGMQGQLKYFWRVRTTSNAGGTGAFSAEYSFTTGFPASPLLVSPANNALDIPVNTTFIWNSSAASSAYSFQVSQSANFSSLLIDSSGITDTTLSTGALQPFTIYFWRVSASNAFGTSNWSDAWRFRTQTATSVPGAPEIPSEFSLKQNYPNPFNPFTTILFALPHQVHVSLRVYDILGREVGILVNDTLPAGNHRAVFDGTNLATGIYFYRLVAGTYSETRKMQMIK